LPFLSEKKSFKTSRGKMKESKPFTIDKSSLIKGKNSSSLSAVTAQEFRAIMPTKARTLMFSLQNFLFVIT
jgi:hypothetical protein